MTADYRVTPKASIGIEYNPVTHEVQPRATWFVSPMNGLWPSVTVGAAADRLSTPRGHAVFITFGRGLGATPVGLFASIKLSTWDRRVAFPFGANVTLGVGTTFQAVNDGMYTHLMLSHSFEHFGLTLHLARVKHPGLQASFRF